MWAMRISQGDFEIPDRPKVGLPGHDLNWMKIRRNIVFQKIMRGHNEEIKYRSPLAEVGIDLKRR